MSELIASTKNHLKQIIPAAKNIIIKLERDHEQYVSKIHVQMPGNVLHAEKKAPTVFEAMDSSYHAIVKQIQKIKSKKIDRNKLMRLKGQLQMGPP
jgi:ribosomal subunit interface protein